MSKNLIIVFLLLIATITVVSSLTDNNSEEVEEEESIALPVNVMGRYEDDLSLKTKYKYSLSDIHKVNGRQGIAVSKDGYYVSDSTSLAFYDKNWKLKRFSEEVFDDFKNEVNHIGDIDVYNNEIYAGVEYFMNGRASNIQIAVFDIKDFSLKRTYNFDSISNQTEVSGIAVDPDSKSIWLCSWADSDSGRYLYQYSLEKGKYLGKYHLQAAPQWIQGIAYLDGYIYISADDGTADLGEADHIYRVKVDMSKTTMPVLIERTLDDVKLVGEIEGLSFDKINKQLLVSYNRGSQIILGMPSGFYEGYDEEIHEIYIYDMK